MSEDLPPAQLKYQQWLQSKQVHASNLVATINDANLIVAGWGCVAAADIKQGTELFSIPREACFGAAANDTDDDDSADDDDDPTTRDTQMNMAISILRCQKQRIDNNKNDNVVDQEEDWSPFLNLLTQPPYGLPWTWPQEFRQGMLRGTELERVVENKVDRIREEYEQVVTQQQQDLLITYQEYVNACAIASSHTNPWFGVSIVPFNTTLNWGKPNVEFDLEDDESESGKKVAHQRIVGRATSNIRKGQELFQAYGTSVADLIYRCGFAPSTLEECDGMDGDVVSIDVADILSIVEETKKGKNHSLNSETLNLKTRRQVGGEESNNQNASITNITHLSSRLDALKMSGALDESPWDGMEGHLTAEIGRPAQSFLQSHESRQAKNHPKRDRENSTSKNTDDRLAYDDGGLSKLVGIFLVLMADDAAWERASIALQSFNDDHKESNTSDHEVDSSGESEAEDDENSAASDDSRKDDITASIILSSIFHLPPHQAEELLQVALHVGTGGNDPWRALLDGLADAITCDTGKEQKKKKRKIRKHQQEEQDCTRTRDFPMTSPYSQHVQLRSAFEATKKALLVRRGRIEDGESTSQIILANLETNTQTIASSNDGARTADMGRENFERSDEFNSVAKEEAFKIVSILRGVEKAILDQALEIVEVTLSE